MGLVAEAVRLRALRSYQVLDTPPEPRLDEIAQAAADLCGTPIALVSLVDRERQFFKAHIGLDVAEIPRRGSFCNQAIESANFFEVPDAAADRRFRSHPLVLDAPFIRYYAAAPLINPENAAIGTLCIIDREPRAMAPQSKQMLQVLSRQVINVLEQRKADLLSAQVRRALDGDLRERLDSIGRHLRELKGPPRDLIRMLMDADSALETVDDAVDVLQASQGLPLRRRGADLAVACRELVASYQEGERAGTLFSASGDCSGFWDLDRLTHAFAALIDRAAPGPVRVSARGLRDSVVITFRAASFQLDGPALRTALAFEIVRAMGGDVEMARAQGGVTLAVCLPRARD